MSSIRSPEPAPHMRENTFLIRSSMALLAMAGIMLASASPALAHTGHAAGGGFLTGFRHPLLGADHVAAMVAVGFWSVCFSRAAGWALLAVFPLAMILGGVLGMAAIPLPGVETGIAASALVIGLAVLFRTNPPLVFAAVIVAFFAIFHGYAHGTEMPGAANPLGYAAGFVVGTISLHLCGAGMGFLIRGNLLATRTAAAAIALTGMGFLTGML